MRDNLVALARGIAYGAHAGQTDKLGEPYIGHVARVAANFVEPELQAIAWLHDVVEDTPVDLAYLGRAGIPSHLTAVVDILTHRRHEPRQDYYARILADDDARAVKLADIADNADPERLAKLDFDTRTRLENKYAAARQALRGVQLTGPKSKLSDADVRAIRLSKDSGPVLAARYGVSRNHIANIRNRKVLTHVV